MTSDFYERKKQAFYTLLEDPTADAEQFDLYAQPLEAYSWAAEFIPGLVVASAGGLFPFQAEGLLLNRYPFYYRSEWGTSSVYIGHPDQTVPYLYSEAYWAASLSDFEGSNPETFITALTRMLPEITRTRYLYRFPCRAHRFLDNTESDNIRWVWEITDQQDEVTGYGNTAAEGWLDAVSPSPYLEQHGFTADRQSQLFIEKEVSCTPVSENQRQYPACDPNWLTI